MVCLLILLTLCFTGQKFLIFMKSSLSIIYFIHVFSIMSIFIYIFVACRCPARLALFVEKVIFASLYCLCFFIRYQWTLLIWVYFWALSHFFTNPTLSWLLSWLHDLLHVGHKVVLCQSSNFVLLQYSVGNLGLLTLHIKFKISLLISTK